jgi:thiol:disulfide interchange protein DsbD
MSKPERARRALATVAAVATLAVALPAHEQANPLPPDRAFRFSARLIDARTVEARFTIADGYYLYRDRIHFAVEPAATGLGVPSLPEGKVKDDQFFGRVETYRGGMIVNLSLKDPKPGQPIVIAAESQGCADIGLCYPPTTQRVTLSAPDRTTAPEAPAEGGKKVWFN